jgi:hypothetical protein
MNSARIFRARARPRAREGKCAYLDREVMPMDMLSLFAARSERCNTIEHEDEQEHDLVVRAGRTRVAF